MHDSQDDPAARFATVERVVAEPLRFKLRLGIGEDAYATLRLRKTLQEMWDVGGVAATGATVAASPAVAGTFFASTASGGLLGMLGMGTAAATPVGWVVAAAVASAGAYYGVTRSLKGWTGACVDTIPRFLNTPMDLLAASLLDLIGGLAARVAAIDGEVDRAERAAIEDHFIRDWGLDEHYVRPALAIIFEAVDDLRVKDLARALASFQVDNPDCNPAAMQAELIQFLRTVMEADGRIDEREELALDAVEQVLREEAALTFAKAGKHVAGFAKDAANAMRGLGDKLPSLPVRRTVAPSE